MTCTKGRDCEYSHSKDSPRADSPTGGRRSICYPYLQGKCTKGKDCKYAHDKRALAVIKATSKGAAAKAQGSPGGTPRGGDPKAAPSGKPKAKASAVALVVHSDDESENESFCSDYSVVSEIARSCLRKSSQNNKMKKNKTLKFNNKRDVVKFYVRSNGAWSKSFNRKRFGKKVSHDELVDQNRIDQIKYEELRSMIKGVALERAVINPKKGNAKGTLNGTWKIDITVNRDQRANDLFVEKFYRCEDDDMEIPT